MSDVDRKAAARRYKETRQPAGIFQVRNTVDGRVLIGVSPNLPGMLNRQRSQLEMGSHPSRQLQSDWNALGPDAFEITVLDALDMPDDPAYDPKDDLKALEEVWLEKLTAAGTPLYRKAG